MKEYKLVKPAKAFFVYDSKKYEFFTPTIEQLDKYREDLKLCKENDGKVYILMQDFLASLGGCDVSVLKKMAVDDFNDLFQYVVHGEKKS